MVEKMVYGRKVYKDTYFMYLAWFFALNIHYFRLVTFLV